jgi:hypothetical protein
MVEYVIDSLRVLKNTHVPPRETGIYFTSVKNKSGIVKQQSLALPRHAPGPNRGGQWEELVPTRHYASHQD